MHEILNSCQEKPNPNFNKNSLILKNPKIFQKNPKPRFQNMKMHVNERKETYQVKRKLEKARKSFGKKIWSEWEKLRRWKDTSVEREIKKNENRIAFVLYIDPQ